MKPRQVRLSHREMQSRYIPEMVLEQLRFHLTAFPDDLRRMLILLLESGMRLSDLCSLSYDCLAQDVAGKPFLRYLELKTKRVRAIPLSPLALEVILEQQQELKGIENGDGRFLFPDPNGRPSSAQIFMKKLNQQASEKNICDATGTVWRFYAHQIRSTVLWRLFMAGPSIMTQFLHHATIEVHHKICCHMERIRPSSRFLPSPRPLAVVGWKVSVLIPFHIRMRLLASPKGR
jgi:integrase/recombinase XerD